MLQESRAYMRNVPKMKPSNISLTLSKPWATDCWLTLKSEKSSHRMKGQKANVDKRSVRLNQQSSCVCSTDSVQPVLSVFNDGWRLIKILKKFLTEGHRSCRILIGQTHTLTVSLLMIGKGCKKYRNVFLTPSLCPPLPLPSTLLLQEPFYRLHVLFMSFPNVIVFCLLNVFGSICKRQHCVD